MSEGDMLSLFCLYVTISFLTHCAGFNCVCVRQSPELLVFERRKHKGEHRGWCAEMTVVTDGGQEGFGGARFAVERCQGRKRMCLSFCNDNHTLLVTFYCAGPVCVRVWPYDYLYPSSTFKFVLHFSSLQVHIAFTWEILLFFFYFQDHFLLSWQKTICSVFRKWTRADLFFLWKLGQTVFSWLQ